MKKVAPSYSEARALPTPPVSEPQSGWPPTQRRSSSGVSARMRGPLVLPTSLTTAPAGAVVSDVGSTKGPLMRALTPEEERRCVGGHPLCGSETGGVGNARASLYDGATFFITPGAHVDAAAYQRLYGFLGAIGARPVAVDPEEHDRLMAVVSHLPHVLANVLMTQAGLHAGSRDALLSAGPSFSDLTRVAGSNRRVWTDIFLENRAALLAALATFQEGLQEVLEALAANDAAR